MKLTTLIIGLWILGSHAIASAESQSLAGKWRFQLDRQDAGVAEDWAMRQLPGTVKLPSGLTEQGIGDPPSLATKWMGGVQNPNWFQQLEFAAYTNANDFKFPYWLTPNLYYMGAAWYQRDIAVPASWANRRVVLFLERAHWETRLWLDGQLVSTKTALGTPHEHDLGRLAPGKHTLTIRVDNRLIVDLGSDAHSVTDHTQGNWNGLIGQLELRATPLVWLDDLQVYPDVAKRTARVKARIGNSSGQSAHVQLDLRVARPDRRSPATARQEISVPTEGANVELDLALGQDAQLWDEFHPALYELAASLAQKNEPTETRQVLFGVRKLATDGTQFTLNGRKIFFRGTLECAIFPKTGHPPTDVDSWKRVLKIARAHGLNLLRFHSWCPPEAAFVAADELGFYFHVEASAWANGTASVGDGKPGDRWIYEETARILKYYGNHPSFMLMPYGNEPGGKNQRAFLGQWIEHFRALDARHLYTSGSGWPEIPQNQFDVVPGPRIQQWGEGLKSRINAKPPETTTDYHDFISKRQVPVVSHEIGQWCVYPDFEEIPKYTGYLKPRNFEIFRDRLEANGMGGLAKQFLFASGKLQALCYKEDIESALRTHGMGGFELLDLHDFPGQGTALVGVLDPFWGEKGYITAREYSRFCNALVPLARMSRRAFTTDEAFSAQLELANFGARPIPDAVLEWKLVGANGKQWAAGKLGPQPVPVDNGNQFGEIRTELKDIPAPAEGKLIVRLQGTKYENDWDIWIYLPVTPIPAPEGVTIVNDLTDAAVAKLDTGGKVLLLIPPERVKGDPELGKVALGFSSIFWNTAWTRGQPPTTLGILCDPKHPLFAGFPTEGYSNWQWWYLIHDAAAMVLTGLPKSLHPDVRVIDDWVTARPLGLVFEAKVGAGRLMVCSIDLEHRMESDPVRTQFRRSLLDYMTGRKFAPKTSVSVAQVRSLMAEPNAMSKLGAHLHSFSSAETGYEAELLLDGDPKSFWHTRYSGAQPDFPHEFQISLPQSEQIAGFTLLPRQDGNLNGTIKDCEVYVSRNGDVWGGPAWKGQLSPGSSLKTVKFAKPVAARFVRFVALSGHVNGPWASAAEFELQVKNENAH
jgi:hypothetical protein